MKFTPLSIEGAWVIEPKIHSDERGDFLEGFKLDEFTTCTAEQFSVKQMNVSASKRGVVRGIHFALVPPSQSKYVQCLSGEIIDVIVDIRLGSPTFGQHELIVLNDQNRKALYISEGLGHGFMANSDMSTVAYLCSEPYNAQSEFGINPLDSELNINWPFVDENLISAKDLAAPSFAEVRSLGILPDYHETLKFRK